MLVHTKRDCYELRQQHRDEAEWSFKWYLWWGIYTLISIWTYSQNSQVVVEAPSLKFFLHGTYLKWSQRSSWSAQVISYAMEQSILFWIWQKSHCNLDNHMIRIFLWRQRCYRINISIRSNKLIQNSRAVRVTVRDPNRTFIYLNKAIWDNKRFNQSISSTRTG